MPVTEKALSIIDCQLQHYLQATPKDNFDRDIWENLKIVSASIDKSGRTGNVQFSIIIPRNAGNHHGIAAGGALATLFDGVTGSAIGLVAKDGLWNGSEVTRSLSMTYYRPVALGEEVKIDCQIVDVGKRLATVRGVMTRAGDDRVLVIHSRGLDKFDRLASFKECSGLERQLGTFGLATFVLGESSNT